MEAGQVRSVYLTLLYCNDSEVGGVLHEIQISKDGKSLIKCTEKKPALPDRRLFDKTQLPTTPFIFCERIGSKLYLFAGQNYYPVIAVPTLAYVFDAKSSGELVEFHDLPTNTKGTALILIAAHGRLYHLATTHKRSGVPIPFEVYDPFTKSWDPLPPVPQCPFVPYDKAPRWYMGYAVCRTCILVSLGYPTLNLNSMISVPVLFNVESGTWHQVKVVDSLGHCFPWRDKAVVIGDTAYALGFKMGSIISFSINKSGSEEDGSLVYSLTRPYILAGLKIFPYPKHPHFKRRLQKLSPLGDLEFCLVQTILGSGSSSGYNCQPFWITTFKIIRKEGTFSKIHTLHSTVLYMSTQDYGRFWPLFCYNPDYEPKEAMLTTIRKERSKIEESSRRVEYDTVDIKPREGSVIDRKENGQKERSSSCTVECSMPFFKPKEDGSTNIGKVDMEEKTSPCNVECLKPEIELRRKGSAKIKGENSPGMVDSNSWDFEPKESVITSKQARRRRKRKVKHSKKKGTKGSSYIVSLVKQQVFRVKSYGRGRTYDPIACLVILFIALVYLF